MNDIELNGDLPELNIDPDTGEILGFDGGIIIAVRCRQKHHDPYVAGG